MLHYMTFHIPKDCLYTIEKIMHKFENIIDLSKGYKPKTVHSVDEGTDRGP